MNTEVINNAVDIWKKIVSKGNFDEDGYDLNETAKIKSILTLPKDKNILEGLDQAKVSVEEFIKAFFEANSTYTSMMNDLLNMFQEIGAKQIDHNIQINFEFDKGLPYTVDLNFFKAQIERWSTIEKEILIPLHPNRDNYWNLYDDLNKIKCLKNIKHDIPIDQNYQIQFNQSSSTELDELLNDYKYLLLEIIKTINKYGKDRKTRWANHSQCEYIFLTEDNWHWFILSQLKELALNFDKCDKERCLKILRDFLQDNAFQKQTIQDRVKVLEDYLNLPFWKKRYELYSVWIFKHIYDVIKTHNHKVHVVDGQLSFPFKETHLATFYSQSGRNVFIYCEKKTPLKNPIGKGRSKNIQPDYSFFIEPLTNIKSSILEIECKQYKKSDDDSFARALIDYSNGRPNSQVFLVNHGEMIPEQIFDKAKELFFAFDPQRCKLFSSLNAASSEIEKLKEAIEQVLLEGIIVEKKSAIKAVLTWNEEPKDLDLAVYYTHSNHTELINYQNSTYKGIEFKEDIINGFGPEEITFFPLETSIYKFVVDDYNKTKKLSQSGAKVQLFVDEQSISTFDINIDTNDIEIWDVCEIRLDQIDDKYFTLRIETLLK